MIRAGCLISLFLRGVLGLRESDVATFSWSFRTVIIIIRPYGVTWVERTKATPCQCSKALERRVRTLIHIYTLELSKLRSQKDVDSFAITATLTVKANQRFI